MHLLTWSLLVLTKVNTEILPAIPEGVFNLLNICSYQPSVPEVSAAMRLLEMLGLLGSCVFWSWYAAGGGKLGNSLKVTATHTELSLCLCHTPPVKEFMCSGLSYPSQTFCHIGCSDGSPPLKLSSIFLIFACVTFLLLSRVSCCLRKREKSKGAHKPSAQ